MLEQKILVTPVGEAVYPKLNRPDTKYIEGGEYSVTMKIRKSDASNIISQIDSYGKEVLSDFEKANKGKNVKVAPKLYNVQGEFVLIKLKLKASGISKKTNMPFHQRPMLFDAKKNPFPVDKLIGAGSKLKVVFALVGYNSPLIGVGITGRIKAVQVLELVEPASYNSLLKEEDGYVSNTTVSVNETETSELQKSFDF